MDEMVGVTNEGITTGKELGTIEENAERTDGIEAEESWGTLDEAESRPEETTVGEAEEDLEAGLE